MGKLIMLCGNFRAAQEAHQDALSVVVQGIETGDDMVQKGREANVGGLVFAGRLDDQPHDVLVFNNNDHYNNGLRLAVAFDKTITPDQLEIHFYDRAGTMHKIWVNNRGRCSDYPYGYFDAIERSLIQLLRWDEK